MILKHVRGVLNTIICIKIIFILLIIFILIAKDVLKKEVFEYDNYIYNFFVVHRNIVLNIFFIIITEFGSAEFLITIAISCIIFIKNKNYKILIPINLASIALINQILKRIFVRQRPNVFRLIEEKGFSFPSGHAMASTAFYGLLIILIFKNVKNKKIRNVLCILLSLLILLIDVSRVYVGVHYASDVIAGTCLSASYLIVLTSVLKTRTINEKEEKIEITEE